MNWQIDKADIYENYFDELTHQFEFDGFDEIEELSEFEIYEIMELKVIAFNFLKARIEIIS
jgi:hypothetical protein